MSDADAQAIDDAAVNWFVLLHEETSTDDDRRRFAAWLAAAPAHQAAWFELERMWGGLDALAPKHLPQEKRERPSVVSFPQSRVATKEPQRTRRSWGRLAAAAVLLIGIGLGTQLVPVGLFADYRAATGERRTIALDDGSIVELGTASALDVDFDSGRRKVTLLAGEAFFTVAKDAGRPFVVAARGGEVKVLGTAFNVKIENSVSVAVAHNSVEVSAAGSAPAVLSVGKEVRYDAGGVSAVTDADLETIQAWRQDRLYFHDAPLSKVLSELQRYRYGRIQLLSSSLGDRRVTAVFDTKRTDAALDTIARSLNLRLVRVTDLFVGIGPN